jgi:hypothetical protein
MPMFKKGKPDPKDAPMETKAAAPAAATAHAPVERSPHRDAVLVAAKAHEAPAPPPAAAPAAGPFAGAPASSLPTPGESLLEGIETEEVAETPVAAIDDAATSNLMHIFTEDQEGLRANATIYDAFMEELTMEKVAANAQQLLSDLRAAK